ncbi:hypothetical protein GIB67_022400, partial [Kingdonia uniflora]
RKKKEGPSKDNKEKGESCSAVLEAEGLKELTLHPVCQGDSDQASIIISTTQSKAPPATAIGDATKETENVALDYIGKRGSTVGVIKKRKRIKYAKGILKREMLSHVGMGEYCEAKKVYYFSFCFVRLAEGLKTTGTITCFDNRQAVNLYNIIIAKKITSGLKYSLATGNWGQANTVGIELLNICIYSVPLEKACGLVKNLALMVYVIQGSAANPILEFLEEWSTTNFEETWKIGNSDPKIVVPAFTSALHIYSKVRKELTLHKPRMVTKMIDVVNYYIELERSKKDKMKSFSVIHSQEASSTPSQGAVTIAALKPSAKNTDNIRRNESKPNRHVLILPPITITLSAILPMIKRDDYYRVP